MRLLCEVGYNLQDNCILSRTLQAVALMRDDIIQAQITTKPRFENANFRFYYKLIPRVAMMKRIHTRKHHEENEGLRKCHVNEAWW